MARCRVTCAPCRTPLCGFVVVAVAVSLALLLSPPARAALATQRIGAAPALPAGARRVGALPAATRLGIDVTLRPRNPAALAAYAAAVASPGDAHFHHYLTLTGFRRRFGPTRSALRAVRRALVLAGLNPGTLSPDGLELHISASVRRIERALGLDLLAVRLPDGRRALTNTAAPRFSAAVSRLIQGVVGLNTLVVPHALDLLRVRGRGRAHGNLREAALRAHLTGAASPCSSATATASADGAYTADQIASAYGFSTLYGTGDSGAGQTVGLLELEQFAPSDISAFQSCYGTHAAVTAIPVDGGAGGPSAGQGEAALDIEQITSLAPGASVDVYESPATGTGLLDGYQQMVDNPAVTVISTSWGECESDATSALLRAEATLFQAAATLGKSVFAAAGDDGSTDCYGSNGAAALAVDDPGSQPYVTSVGGTSLPSASSPSTQVAWNDSSIHNGAGGGGISSAWPMPSYQAGAPASLGVVSPLSSGQPCGVSEGDCREVPDVSADADPQTGYVIYWNGSWGAMGGTSAAAPLWAALTALTNASSACHGSAVGFVNPTLYALAADPAIYRSAFTDITAGSNDYSPSGYTGGLYPATVGFDMATGLGAPQAAALAPDLCDPALALTATTGSSGAGTASGSGTATGSGTTGGTGTTSGTATTSPDGSGTPTPGGGISPSAPAACRPASERIGSFRHVLLLDPHQHQVVVALPFTLPPGCRAETLSLRRLIHSTEPGRFRGRDQLRIAIFSRGGGWLATLWTFSGRQAGAGARTVTINLTRFAGRPLILALIADRGGRASTRFTISAVSLRWR